MSDWELGFISCLWVLPGNKIVGAKSWHQVQLEIVFIIVLPFWPSWNIGNRGLRGRRISEIKIWSLAFSRSLTYP